MSSIQPTLKYIKDFTVMGFSIKTQNKDEFNEKKAKLPSLWKQFYSSSLATNANIFEVYSNYESDANGIYTVTLGIQDDIKQSDFASVNIQSGNYLIFQGIGPMPCTVVDTWKKIWDYFDNDNMYQRSLISDFESYSVVDQVDIYIGLKFLET